MPNTALKKTPDIIIWIAAVFCLMVSLYIAVNCSIELVTPYNYLLGPSGDDAFDASHVTYPILMGEDNLWHMIKPFADHRIFTTRLLALFDFSYTNGTGSTHGLRFLFVIWLTCCLMIKFIFTIPTLNKNTKTLLSGVILTYLFANMSLINYYSAILFTWPQILLYSFLTFIFIDKYCSSQQKYAYLLLSSCFLLLAMYTFNIGLILWPIVFTVLYKRNAWKPHLKSWLTLSSISYLLYFSRIAAGGHHIYWKPSTLGGGLTHFIHHPLTAFSYYSRIISLPMIPTAEFSASYWTYFIGLVVLISSLFFLVNFLRKSIWNSHESILFACLSFSFSAIILISITRFSVPSEYKDIGTRFTTPGLLLWAWLIMNVFVCIAKDKTNIRHAYFQMLTTVAAAVWIFFFVLLGELPQHVVGDVSKINRYFIALATGVPLNESLLDASADYNPENTIERLTYLNQIQKEHHKSAYSLWPADAMNKNIDSLGFRLTDFAITPTINIVNDLRNYNPAIYFDVTIPESQMPDQTSWYVIATDNHNTIAGFAMRAGRISNLNNILFRQPYADHFTWKGVINTDLVNGKNIKFWLSNHANKTNIYIGSQVI